MPKSSPWHYKKYFQIEIVVCRAVRYMVHYLASVTSLFSVGRSLPTRCTNVRVLWAYLYTAADGPVWFSPCQRETRPGCIQLCFCQTWSRTPGVFFPCFPVPSKDCRLPVRTSNTIYSPPSPPLRVTSTTLIIKRNKIGKWNKIF